MILDKDVATTARHWGLDPKLLQAVVQSEGDILKAVRCSVPSTKDRQEALEITCRSGVHALCDWVKLGAEGGASGFVDFWAARWAPVGALNDPTHLNANWRDNVRALWLHT